jgi:hypothetical protein
MQVAFSALSIQRSTDAASAHRATSRAFSYETRPSRIAARSAGSEWSLRSSETRCSSVRAAIPRRSLA